MIISILFFVDFFLKVYIINFKFIIYIDGGLNGGEIFY